MVPAPYCLAVQSMALAFSLYARGRRYRQNPYRVKVFDAYESVALDLRVPRDSAEWLRVVLSTGHIRAV